MRFTHRTHDQRVHFGTGSAAAAVAEAAAALGSRRVFVIASAREIARTGEVLAGVPVAARWDEVVMHVPESLAVRARRAAADVGADLLLSIGGGSATGLAKAVALTSGIPIVAVPTTFAGSEATPVWGLTDDSGKTTGIDDRVLPRAIVYDAALTASLPVAACIASGLNALAHCVGSLWAPRADPVNRALATEGMTALDSGLRDIAERPDGVAGREQTLYATYLAGVAFASAGSGLHHKIAHVLGGAYNLPHASLHAALLPYVTAFNAAADPDADVRIGAALGAPDAVTGLAALYAAVGAPTALRDLGFAESGVDAAAAAVARVIPPGNPREATVDDLRALLLAACRGELKGRP
ncbi:maleylacetate reductase [Gordonia sihwensis]|uniref:maleylacetate reductase n=1 Tax=Gordonia sihwensis TaxID=173559 RepID=UPI0005EE7E21|nr:maleylacetate reductase [Gordonia sihwensis]KJR07707.1 Maleylacetate reductase [Gordonia sihwensis]